MASVRLAFGSFGDIVALIQIIVDLTGTLRDGKASVEYKELIAELVFTRCHGGPSPRPIIPECHRTGRAEMLFPHQGIL